MKGLNDVLGVPFKTPIRSEIVAITPSGFGSTGTKIRNFTAELVNTGSAITHVKSTVNGSTFVINQPGYYVINYSDLNSGGTMLLGISVNASDANLSTSISGLTFATGFRNIQTSSSTNPNSVSWAGNLNQGDIVRAHTDGSGDGTYVRCFFSIALVSGPGSVS